MMRSIIMLYMADCDPEAIHRGDNDAVDILIRGRLSKANLECAQSDYNDPSYRLELVLETGLARPPGEWSFVGLGRHTLSLLWSHRCLLGEAENASKDRRKFLLTRSPPEKEAWELLCTLQSMDHIEIKAQPRLHNFPYLKLDSLL
ncbi:hypothetical protein V8E54_011715 [Elaphomyces granulatus]